MADRDINIPTGPDRSGRITVPEVMQDAGGAPDPTIAQPPVSTADLRGLDVEVAPVEEHPVDAWLSKPMDAVGEEAPVEPVVVEAQPQPQPAIDSPQVIGEEAGGAIDAGPAEEGAEAEAAATPTERPKTDVAASIGALRDSIDQGRELKAREKDRQDLADKIHEDRQELADRDDILANYAAIVAEQDRIIDQSSYERDARKAELSQTMAQIEETTEALSRMRDYNDVQLQPLETALGRAQATADQAKNDERSRKSELNAAESELRRAEKSDDATTERARLEVAQAAYDEAVARSNAAKGALEDAQRHYDSMKDRVEQAEAPLENALEDLNKQSEQLKDEIDRLGEVVSTASKRRQYCDSVYQYPAETEKLRNTVDSDQEALRRLDEENDELRGRLAESKAKSVKAKALIAFVVVLVIVLICLFWFLSSR